MPADPSVENVPSPERPAKSSRSAPVKGGEPVEYAYEYVPVVQVSTWRISVGASLIGYRNAREGKTCEWRWSGFCVSMFCPCDCPISLALEKHRDLALLSFGVCWVVCRKLQAADLGFGHQSFCPLYPTFLRLRSSFLHHVSDCIYPRRTSLFFQVQHTLAICFTHTPLLSPSPCRNMAVVWQIPPLLISWIHTQTYLIYRRVP